MQNSDRLDEEQSNRRILVIRNDVITVQILRQGTTICSDAGSWRLFGIDWRGWK